MREFEPHFWQRYLFVFGDIYIVFKSRANLPLSASFFFYFFNYGLPVNRVSTYP